MAIVRSLEVIMPRLIRTAGVLLLVSTSVALSGAQARWPELRYSPVPDWPALPDGWNFGETAGVAVDGDENVYVFNRSPHPLIQFTPAGKFMRSLLEGMITSAHSVRVDGYGNIWVVDVKGHTVLKLNPAGRVTIVLGRRDAPGTNETSFDQPTDVAVAPSGDFYVTDGYGNSRVLKFSKDGTLVKQWGKKGSAPGEFNLPHAVVLDSSGRVYIGDRNNDRIQIVTPDGEFIKEWKDIGSPWGMAMNAAGEIFMSDGKNDRVLKLSAEGRVLGVLGSRGKQPGQFAYPHHMAVGKKGDIYVSEILNWRVQKFVPR
jgi:DNA-binding beta-propeller fold protein YncE